jgi:hypothetical protein
MSRRFCSVVKCILQNDHVGVCRAVLQVVQCKANEALELSKRVSQYENLGWGEWSGVHEFVGPSHPRLGTSDGAKGNVVDNLSSFSCRCITNHFFSLTDTAASASAVLLQRS